MLKLKNLLFIDLKDEDMDKLLRKQTAVNTITISVDKGNGEIW